MSNSTNLTTAAMVDKYNLNNLVLSLGQAILIYLYCFASAPASFETWHLNCHYHLPSDDAPTFNGHNAVDFLSVYSIC